MTSPPLPPVAELLPHSGTMIFIDRVLAYDRDKIVAETTVRNEPLFPDRPRIPVYVGLEYMAQTIGAFAGLRQLAVGEGAKIGMLLGTRDFRAEVPAFDIGERLTLSATLVFESDDLGVFDCAIHRGSNRLVSARLNVFQPESFDGFLSAQTGRDIAT